MEADNPGWEMTSVMRKNLLEALDTPGEVDLAAVRGNVSMKGQTV